MVLMLLGSGSALASGGVPAPDGKEPLVAPEGDVAIVIGGDEYTASEGDSVTDVGRQADGECGPMPSLEIRMTGVASLVELYVDHEDCQLKVSSIEVEEPPAEPEEGGSASAVASSSQTYYHWFMKTTAARRGFAYVEDLTVTRTHIQAWLPYYGYKGPISGPNSASYECDAWGPPFNAWKVRSCYLMSQNMNSTSSVWIKAMGKFEWLFGIKTTAWAKSEIKGYRIGTDRFKSTCHHTGGFTSPANYVRCERKYGFV